jgi:tetratricopeptide (TPR) repeat protein
MAKKLLKIFGLVLCGVAALVVVAFAAYVYLYYPRGAEPFVIEAENPSKRILIATQGSDFKNSLVAALCDSLESSPFYIRGMDVGRLETVDERDWDRILIINSFIIWLNKDVSSFVDSATDTRKVLLLVTSGGADWQPEPGLRVDALTCASYKSYTEGLVDLILDWMQGEGGERWEPEDYVLALTFLPTVDVPSACHAIQRNRERYMASYPNLVEMINRAGYQFLRFKQLDSALAVFRLNVGLFPDYWNVYDSYGEALLKGGDKEGAIANYRKALELNPDSKSAIEMLSRLGIE